MCGIFLYIGDKKNDEKLISCANKIIHRGPDSTNYKRINKYAFLAFYRLAINGLNPYSDQPIEKDGIYLICNGEIFNYKELIKKYDIKEYKSDSDCEIILHLFIKFGIEETCKLLDGEFSFLIYDSNKNILYSARDQLGIRSLYFSIQDEEICFCSELKGMVDIEGIKQFPIGTYWNSLDNKFVRFYDFKSLTFNNDSEESIINNIKILFIKAVHKRLMSERDVACLLSGGLDSTTVTAIISKEYKPYTLNTYSIGLKGSVDLHYAKIAAKYFKTNHTSIELTKEEFLDAIEKTIIQIESYDTTTVRASIGNYLVSLYIRKNTNDTVIFCGDVSDEIFASYRGFFYADSDDNFNNENIKMLENIQYFDILRSDKSISGAGLEARVPFGDKDFLTYCMTIHPKYKRFSKERIEKYLFRKAFEDILPPELAWRVKTAFSDGISNSEKPWYEIIKEYMDEIISDKEYEENCKKYKINTPYDKESLHYRNIFEKYYPNRSDTIPYFWKQPFMISKDPSAWNAEKEFLSENI